MAGLERVLAVYRMLERMRLAEATISTAGVREVEAGMAEVKAGLEAAQSRRRTGLDDAVERTWAEVCTGSADVMLGRLETLRGERVLEQERTMGVLAESRVRVKQVEEMLRAEGLERVQMEGRRTQAAADDRFAAQQSLGLRTKMNAF